MLARNIALFLSCASLLVACGGSKDSKVYYVVKQQKSASGTWGEWLIQGPPKKIDGSYIFTPYDSSVAERVPADFATVVRIGPDIQDTKKFFLEELRTYRATATPAPSN